ncbi:sigma-70 family RNA polymerase sigma factor [Azoarcus sp. L1K30]|uniref:sigma-70 family RNA polymerase sigma factor n=1 Tax=Azoarcus sp. L1K30 TaxID=2820277 RepID=UPI001B814EE5|nr:sigma-70 family RNA polymerase sigma factor [Azoarcus sp. L1K30]MBR0565870.1 sigma-70 family RNA polymerase sigma factor [Azoarcus sp. L1K30]
MARAQTRTDTQSPADALSDPAVLTELRRDMLRFAQMQLRDAALAEDAVQEAIEAALINAARHEGRAALKTWIFSILRNKIIDILRRGARTVSLSSIGDDDSTEDEKIDALFRENGHWTKQSRPTQWTAPDDALGNKQFWAVFEACLDRLPENIARVFMMREMLGFETSEICTQLEITTNNCHVILYRARAGLRSCLEGNWFQAGDCRTC